jgi:hypothetical protein
MTGQLIKYRSFNDKALAIELYQKLSADGIPVAWEDTEGFFDASFANNEFLNIYYIKIRQEDFKKADEILMRSVSESKNEPVGDYYLLSFSNEELIDVLKKPDEWNEFDRYWAKKILEKKGIDIKQEDLEQARVQRLAELKQPWTLDKLWIICAIALWVAAFWFIHVYGAVAVIFIGGYIALSKKTMPDGQRVKAFSAGDRLIGKIVLAAGFILALFILMQYYAVIDFIRPL